MISENIKQQLQNTSWIRRMFEEGARLKSQFGAENVFDFSLGNPDLEPPREVVEAFREAGTDESAGIHRYMSNAGYDTVREKIAGLLSYESGLPLTKDHIIMTVGAAGALNVALKTLLDPGDEVLVLAPYFVEYLAYIRNSGGVPVVVDCDPDTMQPNIGRIRKAVGEKTKAILINSPNNPSGAVYPEELITSLNTMLAACKNEVYIISDEPYREIVFNKTQVPCTLRFMDNAIICYSWSKSLAVPGERIGYLAASPRMADVNDFIAGAVMCNRSLGFVNAPAMMQRVISRCMDAKVDVSSYERRCNLLYDIITRAGYQSLKPDGGLYLFPRSPIPDDIRFSQIAASHHLLVVPGTGFGMKGYFRLAFCVDEEIIRRSEPSFVKTIHELSD